MIAYILFPCVRFSSAKFWERMSAHRFSSSLVGVQLRCSTWRYTGFKFSFYYSADHIVNNILGLDMKEGWNLVNLWQTSEKNGWKQRKRWNPRCHLGRRENVIDRKDRDISGTGERGQERRE